MTLEEKWEEMVRGLLAGPWLETTDGWVTRYYRAEWRRWDDGNRRGILHQAVWEGGGRISAKRWVFAPASNEVEVVVHIHPCSTPREAQEMADAKLSELRDKVNLAAFFGAEEATV